MDNCQRKTNRENKEETFSIFRVVVFGLSVVLGILFLLPQPGTAEPKPGPVDAPVCLAVVKGRHSKEVRGKSRYKGDKKSSAKGAH